MTRISMLLSNAFRPDPRVAREAAGLVEAGYEVNIIAWDRQIQFSGYETRDGYRIERLHSVHTTYGAGLRQLLNTPRFWREAIRYLRESSPDIVHCHDLDTLPAGWWMKRITGCKLIYDAHENYPAMMSLYLPGLAVSVLAKMEQYLISDADYVITASSVLEEDFQGLGVQHVTTIGNYQDLDSFTSISAGEISRARKGLEITEEDLVIAYIGGFSRNRLILPFIEAVSSMDGVWALIWGDGHQRQAVEHKTAQCGNVRYLGWLPENLVPLYTSTADAIYYCLEPDYAGAVYNAPNTLSNAMAAGRPIIANNVGDLGRIVHQTGCGILVDTVAPDSICLAIDSLRNVELRRSLGMAGRGAAEGEYNWGIAKQRLLDVYRQLNS